MITLIVMSCCLFGGVILHAAPLKDDLQMAAIEKAAEAYSSHSDALLTALNEYNEGKHDDTSFLISAFEKFIRDVNRDPAIRDTDPQMKEKIDAIVEATEELLIHVKNAPYYSGTEEQWLNEYNKLCGNIIQKEEDAQQFYKECKTLGQSLYRHRRLLLILMFVIGPAIAAAFKTKKSKS